MIDLLERRRFFAEELEAVCKLRSPALVDAFATVPREQFLPPGPWTVMADSDFMSGMRLRATPDADPARICHNIAVAIDPSRQLFNGQPGTIGVWIDALDLGPGARVLHIGCGLGYYTAVMAHCVGPTGRVLAFEVDERLAAEARQNLASLSWVGVSRGDGAQALDETFDAVLSSYVASDFSRTTETIRLKPDPTYEGTDRAATTRQCSAISACSAVEVPLAAQ
jgi:protein-L-isoaspartate(D-aspartate) O-methyltransferase